MNFTDFKNKFEKEPVEEYPNKVSPTPVVSVCVTTYNHAKYIKECLDSILIQKTEFDVEILIGEDDSTDGTREICIDYAKRYPDKVRLFLHHRANVIKIDGAPTGRFNFVYDLFSTKGKYIALCDGDDYWIHPLKLQKQVDFLDSRIDCAMCFTDVKLLSPSGEIIDGTNLPPAAETAMEDLASNDNYIFTSTTLFRKENFIVPSMLLKMPVGDYPLYLLLSTKGKIKFLQEYTTVYRIGDGLWGKQDYVGKCLIWVKIMILLIEHFKDNEAMQNILKKRYQEKCSKLLQASLQQNRPWLEIEKYNFFLFKYKEWKYYSYFKHVVARIFIFRLRNFLRSMRFYSIL